MIRKIILIFAVLGSISGYAQPLQPSNTWSYKVHLNQDVREISRYGLCKLGDAYHLFMTGGITYKTRNLKDWDMYYAIPFERLEDKKLHGGPKADCGEDAYFASIDWGLYFFDGNRWVEKGSPLPGRWGYLSLVTGDRQKMYYSRSDTNKYDVSSDSGWWQPSELKYRKDYYYTYYQSEFGFVGFPRENFNNKPPVHIKNNKVTVIKGIKPGFVDGGFFLNGTFYMTRREGKNGAPWQFTAYKIDDEFNAMEIDFSPLYLTEAGPYRCYNAQPDLAICQYNYGLVFVAETPTGIGAVSLPLGEGQGMRVNYFFVCTPGVDTLYCDNSEGKYIGGLSHWVGAVSEFRYDDIVRRIQDDYVQYKKQQKSEAVAADGKQER